MVKPVGLVNPMGLVNPIGLGSERGMDIQNQAADKGGGSPKYKLTTPVQFLPGVGSQRAELLAKLDLTRAVDLLFYFPRSYLQPASRTSVLGLVADVRCSLVGEVAELEQRTTADGRIILGVLVRAEDGFIRTTWFNQPYRSQQLRRGTRWLVTGIPRLSGMTWEMVHPELIALAPGEEPPAARPQAIYPLTEGVQPSTLRKAIESAIEHVSSQVEEAIPERILLDYQLLRIGPALRAIHQPESPEQVEQARRRFIFQELLTLQLALASRRMQRRHQLPAPVLEATAKIHSRILRRFPFELTDDQLRAIDEVGRDMGKSVPMNRLLQGDVGSGKTVVAQYAMLLAVAHGYQAALMAPTEVLARQHARTLSKGLAESRVHVDLLVGSISASERNRVLDSVALGTTDLVVGTQALLSDKVQFHKLGLVIIDEQHRFGVEQRGALRQGETQPHSLVLTATPIPRTVTMTLFGDLDVSTIRQRPPGRAPVNTYLGREGELASWWDFVAKQIKAGRQAYVVTPRVEENEESEGASVQVWYEILSSGRFRDFRLAMLHGRMSGEEKEDTLNRFAAGEIDLLVTTTVVEVGIDVPNATVMTVLDADRFGLAQLHQLRGRISRGTQSGYFCAFATAGSSSTENSRLSALASTEDGFRLAELDFEMRGPGDVLGTRQHGLPPMRIADITRDGILLADARQAAQDWVASDPELHSPEVARLKKQMLARYGERLQLSDIG